MAPGVVLPVYTALTQMSTDAASWRCPERLAERHSVLRKVIRAYFSPGERSRPKRWPFTE